MQQGLYANPSVSILSLDQSKQLNSPNGKIAPAVLFPLMTNGHFFVKFSKCQKTVSALPHDENFCWNYFAFNQSYLVKGKIAPVVFCLIGQNKNAWFNLGRSGLDWTGYFQKFCRSGLDRIQFDRIRTGLGLKNFTVRSSLLDW